MHITFRSPTNLRNLCVAKIDSAETNDSAKLLMLYGSFKGRPALFRIPIHLSNVIDMADLLCDSSGLFLYNEYTAKITTETNEQITIDFYKN